MSSTEILTTLLTVFTTIISVWAINSKNNSLAKTRQQVADADQKRMKAEGELADVKAEADQKTALAQIAERQQTLLEALKLSQDNINSEMLTRWANISLLFSDVRAGETNIYNTLVQISSTMGEISAAQKLLPDVIKQSTADTVRETATVVGAEIGAAMAREFAMKNTERKLFVFPDAEDKRWHDDWIIPLVPDLILSKQPYFDDDVKLKKSCSKILAEGEKVRLIEEADIDAVAIWKEQDGVPCYGWLPRNRIKIGQPAPETPAISS